MTSGKYFMHIHDEGENYQPSVQRAMKNLGALVPYKLFQNPHIYNPLISSWLYIILVKKIINFIKIEFNYNTIHQKIDYIDYHGYILLLGPILPLVSMIFLLDFGTVLTVYLFYVILLCG